MSLALSAYFGAVIPAFFICALAVAGGIGGGALYMPIYIFLTGNAHIAVPLSKITTNGVAWSGFLFNVVSRHPKGGPMIDYDVALIMEPLTLLGTVAGVLLNVRMTTAEVLLTLVVVLSITAWTTFDKGFEQKAKEESQMEQQAAQANAKGPTDRLSKEAYVELIQKDHEACETSEECDVTSGEDAEDYLEHEQRQYPWQKMLFLAALLGVHAATLVSIGGPKGLLCGGLYPVLVMGVNVLVQCMATLVWRRLLLQKQAKRSALGLPASSYHLSRRSTIVYPLLSLFAGVCAGALGIAGGLVKGPMMVNWGLLPQSATATAIFMIMFTSSSTIIQFMLLGRLELVSSIVFWLTGFIGGLLGSKVFAEAMKRSGRQSFLTLFLGILILLSAVSMSGVSVLEMTGVFKAHHGAEIVCST